MGNFGYLKLSDTILLTIGPKLTKAIHTFIQQGEDISQHTDTAKSLQVYTLHHPDFTEPDGAEYMLTVTHLDSGEEYISSLQAFRGSDLITVKEYENPYAHQTSL